MESQKVFGGKRRTLHTELTTMHGVENLLIAYKVQRFKLATVIKFYRSRNLTSGWENDNFISTSIF